MPPRQRSLSPKVKREVLVRLDGIVAGLEKEVSGEFDALRKPVTAPKIHRSNSQPFLTSSSTANPSLSRLASNETGIPFRRSDPSVGNSLGGFLPSTLNASAAIDELRSANVSIIAERQLLHSEKQSLELERRQLTSQRKALASESQKVSQQHDIVMLLREEQTSQQVMNLRNEELILQQSLTEARTAAASVQARKNLVEDFASQQMASDKASIAALRQEAFTQKSLISELRSELANVRCSEEKHAEQSREHLTWALDIETEYTEMRTFGNTHSSFSTIRALSPSRSYLEDRRSYWILEGQIADQEQELTNAKKEIFDFGKQKFKLTRQITHLEEELAALQERQRNEAQSKHNEQTVSYNLQSLQQSQACEHIASENALEMLLCNTRNSEEHYMRETHNLEEDLAQLESFYKTELRNEQWHVRQIRDEASENSIDSTRNGFVQDSMQAKAESITSIAVAALQKVQQQYEEISPQRCARAHLTGTYNEQTDELDVLDLSSDLIEKLKVVVKQAIGNHKHVVVDVSVSSEYLQCDIGVHCNISVLAVVEAIAWALRDEHDSSGLQAVLAEAGVAEAQVAPRWPLERVQAEVRLAFGYTLAPRTLKELNVALSSVCSAYHHAWDSARREDTKVWNELLNMECMMLFIDPRFLLPSQTSSTVHVDHKFQTPTQAKLLSSAIGQQRRLLQIPAKQGANVLSELIADATVAQRQLKERLAPHTLWAQEIFGLEKSRSNQNSRTWLSGADHPLPCGWHFDPGLKDATRIQIKARCFMKHLDTDALLDEVYDISRLTIVFESTRCLLQGFKWIRQNLDVVFLTNLFRMPSSRGVSGLVIGVRQLLPSLEQSKGPRVHISEIFLTLVTFHEICNGVGQDLCQGLQSTLDHCDVSQEDACAIQMVLLRSLDCTDAQAAQDLFVGLRHVLDIIGMYASVLDQRGRAAVADLLKEIMAHARCFSTLRDEQKRLLQDAKVILAELFGKNLHGVGNLSGRSKGQKTIFIEAGIQTLDFGVDVGLQTLHTGNLGLGFPPPRSACNAAVQTITLAPLPESGKEVGVAVGASSSASLRLLASETFQAVQMSASSSSKHMSTSDVQTTTSSMNSCASPKLRDGQKSVLIQATCTQRSVALQSLESSFTNQQHRATRNQATQVLLEEDKPILQCKTTQTLPMVAFGATDDDKPRTRNAAIQTVEWLFPSEPASYQSEQDDGGLLDARVQELEVANCSLRMALAAAEDARDAAELEMERQAAYAKRAQSNLAVMDNAQEPHSTNEAATQTQASAPVRSVGIVTAITGSVQRAADGRATRVPKDKAVQASLSETVKADTREDDTKEFVSETPNTEPLIELYSETLMSELQATGTSVKRLLAEKGVRAGQTYMRVSLLWKSSNYDLDLSVSTPKGMVYHGKKIVGGFVLDVDDKGTKNGIHIESISARRALADGSYWACSRYYAERARHTSHEIAWQAFVSIGAYTGIVQGTHDHVGESIMIFKFEIEQGVLRITDHAGQHGHRAFFLQVPDHLADW